MTEPYQSPAAVEAAIREAARNAYANDRSMSIADRIRQEHFRRFLSRIFSEGPDSGWVLKGGTGVLARLASARRTNDVDLSRSDVSLDQALAELIRLAAVDLADFFLFVYRHHAPSVGGDQQPYTDGYGVDFEVYVGADKKEPLHVDLVVGVVLTGEITVSPPANRLDLPRLPSNAYRLYPIVDQIADKVCATMATHGGRPSSREKDLVDLVSIAVTQVVNANELKQAVDHEAAVRSLPAFTDLVIPSSWGRVFAKEAKDVPYCANYRTVSLASELMRRFLRPVLTGSAAGKTWSPDRMEWTGASSREG